MRVCSVEGCNMKHMAKGYCSHHYGKIIGKSRPTGKCVIEGCNKTKFVVELGLCSMHYARYKSGKEMTDRTRYDLNEINVNEDIAEIILYNKNNKTINKAIIDSSCVDVVRGIKWGLASHGYVVNSGTNMYLHRLIMNNSDGIIDHINRNKLDNRKSNLRICEKCQNLWNSEKPTTNKSGYKGVSWNKNRQQWVVYIRAYDIHKCFGYFDKLEDAILVAKQMYNKYHGEYSYYREV